jgi:23S rRNA (adenine2503-C2)-methyltransferase
VKIVKTSGDENLAMVFLAETDDGSLIEFVESVQPPLPRDKKWVLIVSTLKGCPVNCPICDAGGHYGGRLSADEIIWQINHLIRRRFKNGSVPVPHTKIQFARMGDPAFNPAVLTVLKKLPSLFDIPGVMPSISTVAPVTAADFLKDLKNIKDDQYPDGKFQMQFSVHTTDDSKRKILVPANTMTLAELARQGELFFTKGDRKITLNFAAVNGFPVDAASVAAFFNPSKFIIKLTPVNPTMSAAASHLKGSVIPGDSRSWRQLEESFKNRGYEVIISIGEQEENRIGSNCGMYVAKYRIKTAGQLKQEGQTIF